METIKMITLAILAMLALLGLFVMIILIGAWSMVSSIFDEFEQENLLLEDVVIINTELHSEHGMLLEDFNICFDKQRDEEEEGFSYSSQCLNGKCRTQIYFSDDTSPPEKISLYKQDEKGECQQMEIEVTGQTKLRYEARVTITDEMINYYGANFMEDEFCDTEEAKFNSHSLFSVGNETILTLKYNQPVTSDSFCYKSIYFQLEYTDDIPASDEESGKEVIDI